MDSAAFLFFSRQFKNMTTTTPGKRLALFFDGTWNTPEDQTNVSKLYELVSATGSDGKPQLKNYDAGVGTHWFDRLSGGAFGAGLSKNVKEGYAWLQKNYAPGDEIFLFRRNFHIRSVFEEKVCSAG